MKKGEDYLWALAEMVPGVPPCAEAIMRRLAQSVRWRRAAVVGPALTAMLAAGTPGFGQASGVVHDPMTYLGMIKRWYTEDVNNFITAHTELSHWLSNAFVAYKSAKMANSIAQRVRHGDVNFLVEFALPKLDFISDKKPDGTFTRTTISFVPGPGQSFEDLNWLMRNGNRALQEKVVAAGTKAQKFREQTLAAIKSALLNPEGDVVTTSIKDGPDGRQIEMSRPEVWNQLAVVDATVSWITAQNRFGIATNVQDQTSAAKLLEVQAARSRSVQVQDAYSRLIELQTRAAETGANLYDDPNYKAALEAYYALAAADNASRRGPQGGVETQTAAQQLRNLEERVTQLQEVLGGASISLNAAQNRQEATRKNLNEIGKAYPGSTFKDPGLMGWIQNPVSEGDSQKIILGTQLKVLALLQALSQDIGEMNKRQAAHDLKESKEAIDKEAAKKAALLAQNKAPAVELAKAARDAAGDARGAAGRVAGSVLAAAKVTTELPELPVFSGKEAPVFVELPAVVSKEQKAAALAKADAAFEVRQKREVMKTVEAFRKDLSSSLSGFKGGQGFLSNVLFASACALKEMTGGTFNLKEEAEAWRTAGEQMNAVYTGTFDYGLVGVDPKPPVPVSPVVPPMAPAVPTPVPPVPPSSTPAVAAGAN